MRHLDRLLELGALEGAPADRGVFALVVLAHDEVVDVARLAVGQRRFQALEQPHGAQVHVLLEAAADRDQQAPQRHVVGHAGPADGAQEDGIVLGDLREPVGRHHGAGLGEALAGPVEMVPGVVDAEARAHRLQHADALRHHLVADAVARDDGDLELVGWLSLRLARPWRSLTLPGAVAVVDCGPLSVIRFRATREEQIPAMQPRGLTLAAGSCQGRWLRSPPCLPPGCTDPRMQKPNMPAESPEPDSGLRSRRRRRRHRPHRPQGANAVRRGLHGVAGVGRRRAAAAVPRRVGLVDALDPQHPGAVQALRAVGRRHPRARRLRPCRPSRGCRRASPRWSSPASTSCSRRDASCAWPASRSAARSPACRPPCWATGCAR